MQKFRLYTLTRPGALSEAAVSSLRSLPGVHVLLTLTTSVCVRFDGEASALRTLVADMQWDVRAPSTSERPTPIPGPSVDDVLMEFAVSEDHPSGALLHSYLVAYPHYRTELIEFASDLVLERFLSTPPDTDGGC